MRQQSLAGLLAPLRLAVCGGRGYSNRARIFAVLDLVVIDRGAVEAFMAGDASGADRLAWEWARARRIPQERCTRYEADWDEAEHLTGKCEAAGPIRNRRMIREGKPNVLVAAPGDDGTADCVRQAKAAGVEVVYV
jgi:hypothetical protein